MQTVFDHLKEMRNLQVLMPFLLLGWAVVIFAFSPWMLLAILWGALLQFLFEYILHRFAYHGPPPTDQGAFSKLYRTHLAHHEFPGDPRFLPVTLRGSGFGWRRLSCCFTLWRCGPWLAWIWQLGWRAVQLLLAVSAPTYSTNTATPWRT